MGDELAAGSINLAAPLTACVIRAGRDMRHAAIVALVRSALTQRPRLVRSADRLAGPFLWAVLALALGAAFAWSVTDPSRTTDRATLDWLDGTETPGQGLQARDADGRKSMCPYARFQSAMFDKDTMIISCDTQCGPRPKSLGHAALAAQGKGDCSVDVCDGVMHKMNYPRGLIRFATQNGLKEHWDRPHMLRRVFRPRVLVYTGILVLIVTAYAASLAMRSPFRVDVVRDRGALARLVEDGRVENVYRLQVMNAQERSQTYRIAVEGLDGIALASPQDVTLGATEARWVPVNVQLPPATASRAGPGAHAIRFHVVRRSDAQQDEVAVTEKSTFVVPR